MILLGCCYRPKPKKVKFSHKNLNAHVDAKIGCGLLLWDGQSPSEILPYCRDHTLGQSAQRSASRLKKGFKRGACGGCDS